MRQEIGLVSSAIYLRFVRFAISIDASRKNSYSCLSMDNQEQRTEIVDLHKKQEKRAIFAGSFQEYRTVWLITILLTALSLIVHIKNPSTLHFSNDLVEQIVHGRMVNSVFKMRPLTNYTTLLLVNNTPLDWRASFFSLQFFLFFLTGPAFYFYLRHLFFSHKLSVIGMIIFMLSLPVFLAHFEPIHTWDDFWVYLFIPLSFGFVIKQRFIVSIVTMAIALLARETSFLFLPVLALIIYENRKGELLKVLFVPTLSFVVYYIIKLLWVGGGTASPDFTLYFNFDGWIRSRDTIFSFVVSLGFLWVVGLKEIISPSNRQYKYAKTVRYGSFFLLAGFLSSTILFGRIRETRLFMPIAILFIPLALVYMQANKNRFKGFILKYLTKVWVRIGCATLLLALSIGTSKLLFPSFEYRRWEDGNVVYMGIHIAIVLCFSTYELLGKRRV